MSASQSPALGAASTPGVERGLDTSFAASSPASESGRPSSSLAAQAGSAADSPSPSEGALSTAGVASRPPESVDFSSPPLFSLFGEEFRQHEWVRLKSPGAKDWVAQIVGFHPSPSVSPATEGLGQILCRWAWDPADLKAEVCPDLPVEVYSRYELIPAINFADVNPVASIKAKLAVLTAQQWAQLRAFPDSAQTAAAGLAAKREGEASSSANAADDEDAGGGGLAPALFFRHSFDVDCGFDPQIPLEVCRFKRLCVKSERDRPEATAEREPFPPASRFRKYLTARNPDMRLFYCERCRCTYGPPDDVEAPPWKPGPSQRSELEEFLRSKDEAASAVKGAEAAVSAENAIFSLLREELQREQDEASATRNAPSAAPLVIPSPACLPFLFRTFPAQADVSIICWKCLRKAERSAAAGSSHKARLEAEAARREGAGAAAPQKPAGASAASSSRDKQAGSASIRRGQRRSREEADSSLAVRPSTTSPESRAATGKTTSQTGPAPAAPRVPRVVDLCRSETSSSSDSSEDFDEAQLREEFASLREEEKAELKMKERMAANQRPAASGSGRARNVASASSAATPSPLAVGDDSFSKAGGLRTAGAGGPPGQTLAAGAASGRRGSNAAGQNSVKTNLGGPGASPAGVAAAPPLQSRDWTQGAARRLERLKEVWQMGMQELTPSLQLQAEVEAAEKLKAQCEGHAAAADSAKNAREDEEDVGLTRLRVVYKSASEFANAVHEAFCAVYGDAPARLRQQRLFELLSNLRRPNNTELRSNVLLGRMSLSRLLTADADALAPAAVRRERREERERHFRRDVLLTEAPERQVLVRKTHRGLEQVERDAAEEPPTEALQRKAVSSSSSSSSSFSSSGSSSSDSSSESDADSSTPEVSVETAEKVALQPPEGNAQDTLDVKKEYRALQQLFKGEEAAGASVSSPKGVNAPQEKPGAEGPRTEESAGKPLRVRFAEEVKEPYTSRPPRRLGSSGKRQSPQQQRNFEFLEYLVPEGLSRRPLRVPPSVSAYTPEESRARLLLLLERTQQVGQMRIQRAQQTGSEEEAAVAVASANDLRSLKGMFSDILTQAFGRVSGEVSRFKGEAA